MQEIAVFCRDTPEANLAWAQKEQLPFSLISDHNNTLRSELGVKNGLLGLAPGRQVGSKFWHLSTRSVSTTKVFTNKLCEAQTGIGL